jgi:hypothetical protein
VLQRHLLTLVSDRRGHREVLATSDTAWNGEEAQTEHAQAGDLEPKRDRKKEEANRYASYSVSRHGSLTGSVEVTVRLCCEAMSVTCPSVFVLVHFLLDFSLILVFLGVSAPFLGFNFQGNGIKHLH